MRKAIWSLVGAGSALALYARLRPRMNDWGVRPDEKARVYPGDEVVPAANDIGMMAIEVNAPPEAIWPWLMQLGQGRGGLYSYDWLDRLFGILDAPSARTLLPGTRELRPGDKIPISKNPKWAYTVRVVIPHRALVVFLENERQGWQWSWSFLLVPEGNRTRLISRGRSYVPPRLTMRGFWAAIALPSFIMTRKMLLNLRDRAEALAGRQPAAAPLPAFSASP
jgi:hypothetical protein